MQIAKRVVSRIFKEFLCDFLIKICHIINCIRIEKNCGFPENTQTIIEKLEALQMDSANEVSDMGFDVYTLEIMVIVDSSKHFGSDISACIQDLVATNIVFPYGSGRIIR